MRRLLSFLTITVICANLAGASDKIVKPKVPAFPAKTETRQASKTKTTKRDGLRYQLNWKNKTASVSADNKSIISANIPSHITVDGTSFTVKSISNRGFLGCEKMTSVTIPNSVTSIGESAFYYCESLISCTLPPSINTINNDTFQRCLKLESITIPNSVRTIGDGAFWLCEKLKSVNIPASVTSIGECAFFVCKSLTSITIPDGVTSIGRSAFSHCDDLQSINVSESNSYYSSINGVLFNKAKTTIIAYPCGRGGDYHIPNSVNIIGYNAFEACRSLSAIDIPNSVTTIENNAFSYIYGDKGLRTISIPASVTRIGTNAFYNSSFTTLYCYAKTPPQAEALGDSINKKTLHVPKGCKNAYANAPCWKNFKTIIDDL